MTFFVRGNCCSEPWLRSIRSLKSGITITRNALAKRVMTDIVRNIISQVLARTPEDQCPEVGDLQDYTMHSLRRGGASYAFRCRVPETRIKLQGRWKSSQYMEYIHLHEEELAELTRTLGL